MLVKFVESIPKRELYLSVYPAVKKKEVSFTTSLRSTQLINMSFPFQAVLNSKTRSENSKCGGTEGKERKIAPPFPTVAVSHEHEEKVQSVRVSKREGWSARDIAPPSSFTEAIPSVSVTSSKQMD
jgi:hypothetical protein